MILAGALSSVLVVVGKSKDGGERIDEERDQIRKGSRSRGNAKNLGKIKMELYLN